VAKNKLLIFYPRNGSWTAEHAD